VNPPAGDSAPSEPDEASLAALSLDTPATRIVVVGGGIAGLVAARDCARPGFEVTLLEASEDVGGCVGTHEVAGLRLDSGAESFATRGGHVAALIEELGLGERLVTPNPEGAWVRMGAHTVPLPKAGLLGIPSSPLASDVIRAIGWSGAFRAYADRLMPVLKIGQEHNLGALVRRRMGRRVLERLVAPVTTGVYSAAPDELDVTVVAPGLNRAITRAGSLSGAVGELRAAAKAGSAVGGLSGGMSTLVTALADEVVARGGRIETGARVVALRPLQSDASEVGTDGASAQGFAGEFEPSADDEIESIEENETEVEFEESGAGNGSPDAEAVDAEHSQAASWVVRLEDGTELQADAVILAAPGPVALQLLGGAGPQMSKLTDLGWPDASSVELATLVIDLPALDAAPRGTGILVAEDGGGVEAKALTHATAKWSWLAERAGAGRHVLRLSYGRAGKESRTAGLDDDAFRELARTDAGELLGIPIPESAVAGFARTPWTNALPFAAVGERQRIADVREAVAALDGLEVTGAWLTGTGLASVVPDAREAARAARGLRWRRLADNI
jgi:oxygen-dependent protoporphyrinogen oxidase